jgi:hypothetical protein
VATADLIPPRFRGPGLTPSELARVQGEAEVSLPEDLAELLTACLPTGPGFPDWRGEPAVAMTRWREQVLEGVLFDVDANAVWLDQWGERPADGGDARDVATELVRSAPDLIPIYGHRGIPDEPLEPGNPVFSVVQTDVIVYGVDLEDYLRNEFHRQHLRPVTAAERDIRFWTVLARA